jgi:D-xylose reductase
VPFEKRYPPEWIYDPDAPDAKMVLDKVPVQDTWRAMESLVDAGLTIDIGVSNFNIQAIRDVFSYARIPPAVLQVELHPLLQQSVLLRYATSMEMHVTAYSPMGHGASYGNEKVAAIKEEAVIAIAKKHGEFNHGGLPGLTHT